MNNTYKHTSDKASARDFDPTGSAFPSNVTDVQTALALAGPSVPATETQSGRIQIATQDEVNAGVDNSKAVTPRTLEVRLQRPIATTTVPGVIRLSTQDEVNVGVSTNTAVTPETLSGFFIFKQSTETAPGTLKISNTSAATAGVDDTTAMTPLKVKQAIAAATSNIPSYTQATETDQGVVTLATIGQIAQGLLRDGYAISPYGLSQLTGNNTRKGIVQAATQAQANTGTDEGLYISAKGFKTYTATTSNVGTVKLTESLSSAPGLALSGNAKVLGTDGTNQTVAGRVNFTDDLQHKGSTVASQQYVIDSTPIGSMTMWFGDNDPAGGLYQIARGQSFLVSEYPQLFAVFGYKFGGAGDTFYAPDMRGLFTRGAGAGRDILAARGVDSKNKPLLGNDVSGGAVGEVQKQQVIKHKHVTTWGESNRSGSGYTFGGTQGNRFMGDRNQADFDNSWMFTNDGTEIESDSIRREYSTLNSAELMGGENRPWNMAVNYIIKVK